MKFLEAGTPRYLLIDGAEVDRNYQRRAARGAVAVVAEADPNRPGAYIYYTGFGAQADGPVALAYEPTGKVAILAPGYGLRRKDVRAAYMTYGRIAIAESVEEAESLVLTAPEAPDTTTTTAPTAEEPKRPSAKKPAVKKSEEDSK